MLNHDLLAQNMIFQLDIFNKKKEALRSQFPNIMQSLASGLPMKVIVDALKAAGMEISITMLKAILKVLAKESENVQEVTGERHAMPQAQPNAQAAPHPRTGTAPVMGHPGHTYGQSPFGTLHQHVSNFQSMQHDHGQPPNGFPNPFVSAAIQSPEAYAGI